MNKYASILLLVILLYGCSTVPITGRKQISLVTTDQVLPASLAKYKETLKEQPLSKDRKKTGLLGNNESHNS